MIISVLSGKGGTGKTTVATSLFSVSKEAVYVDCDVEEPNGHLFLKPSLTEKRFVTVRVPLIDKSRCNGCGRCAEVCQFNALVNLKNQVLLFPKLCHSCGACLIACEHKAVIEELRAIGFIAKGTAGGKKFYHGILNIGEPMAVPVINELIKEASVFREEKDVIIDCPPGSSCSVIAAIENTDFCVLVTEPSPFGLHDLKIAVQLVEYLKIPFGIVINKAEEGVNIIRDYCRENNWPVLTELPYDKNIALRYSTGKLIEDQIPDWKNSVERLMRSIKEGGEPCEAVGCDQRQRRNG